MPYVWEGPREVEVPAGQRKSVPVRLVMPGDAPTAGLQSDVLFEVVISPAAGEGETGSGAQAEEAVRARKLSRFVRPELEATQGDGGGAGS